MLKLFIFPALFIYLVFSAPLDSNALVDVTACLKVFYEAAYSRVYTCTQEYDIYSKDYYTRKLALGSGKYCFVAMIQEICSKSQFSWFRDNYDEIIQTIAEEPEDGASCSDLHFTYNAQRCTPIIKDFGEKAMKMAFDRPKMNDQILLNVIDLCGKIQICFPYTCYYTEESKRRINSSCEAFKLLNSPFSDCMTNLQLHPPPSSKYSCLNGREFNAIGKETEISMLTTYKNCTREIMKDSCGEKALEDFDEYAAISVKFRQKIKAKTQSFYGK